MTQKTVRSISILGCGWFGTPLAVDLVTCGYTIKGSTTTAEKLPQLEAQGITPYVINIDGQSGSIENSALEDFMQSDLLIVNIPPRRNSSEKQHFLKIVQQILQASSQGHVRELIFISSTAVYGDHNAEVDEKSATNPDTESGKILLEAENILQHQTDLRTTIVRFGGLVGPNRNPGRFLAGKTNIANGLAPVNLIHLTDCIGIVKQIIKEHAFGYVFNAVAPSHPSRQTFYTQAARNSKLQEPQFISEINHWKTVNSIHLQSVLKYAFERPNWEDWI